MERETIQSIIHKVILFTIKNRSKNISIDTYISKRLSNLDMPQMMNSSFKTNGTNILINL